MQYNNNLYIRIIYLFPDYFGSVLETDVFSELQVQLSQQSHGTSKLFCMFANGDDDDSPKTFNLHFETLFLFQLIGIC